MWNRQIDRLQILFDGIPDDARRRELKERPIAPKDLQAANRAIKRIAKVWGKYRLDEFNTIAVHEKLIHNLRYESRAGKQIKYSKLKPKERNAKTVENLLSYMSIVFNFAVEDGLISVNPIPSVKKLLPAKFIRNEPCRLQFEL